MLSASLAITGLIQALITRRSLKILAIALLVVLATGRHFSDANLYRKVNNLQAQFFQQLAWRAPGIEAGTVLLTNTDQEVILNGDNSLTAALNWIYDNQPPYGLDYVLFYVPDRLKSGDLPELKPGQAVSKDFRTTQFKGSTDQALVVYYAYPNCLRVLDAEVD